MITVEILSMENLERLAVLKTHSWFIINIIITVFTCLNDFKTIYLVCFLTNDILWFVCIHNETITDENLLLVFFFNKEKAKENRIEPFKAVNHIFLQDEVL